MMTRGKWIIFGIGWSALLLAGCGNYEYNRRTMRFERIGPRPRPHVAVTDQDREQMPPPAQMPKADLSTKQRTALARGQVFRFYMGDATAQQTDDLRQMYMVRRATPGKMAELMALLFPGEGPGGSERIRWIVYSNEDTLAQAREFAPQLDFPASNGNLGASDWENAVGLIYESDFPRKVNPDARFKVVTRLTQVVESPAAPADTRWAAGILAATLYARYEPKDPVAASAILSRAGKVIRGQDYKALVVRYHHIRQLQMREQNLTAQKQAQETLNQFQSCEDTDCYRLVRQVLEEKKK